MASSRKRPSAKALARGARIAVGLSGGVDSVVLLHQLKALRGLRLRAIHVHHGLSPNADAWEAFCRRYCKRLAVPLTVRKVKVVRKGKGIEAAAREARYACFLKSPAGTIALAHNLDDQAETVLMNLLRGAGVRGASGMAERSRLGGKLLLRPLLGTSRREILAYAREHGLDWVEDESNANEALTRNFIRRRIGPLLESRFPAWKESLARAARHFAAEDLGARALLREFLREQGVRAPTEAKLVEMLKQLTAGGARTLVEHEGLRLRVYRGKLAIEAAAPLEEFGEVPWRGERSLPLPALGGELRFRSVRGKGIAVDSSREKRYSIRLRSGGERLQPDPRRPRRTLKNLFQEAGVPPWERERLPLIFCGDDLVWVPGLGVDARYQARDQARGVLPEWSR